MEENEEKGFVFRDRRKISVEDLEREQPKAEGQQAAEAQKGGGEGGEAAEKARQDFEKASRRKESQGSMPLPEVTFSTFVFSLSSSALVHLGEIPDPASQHVAVDLPLAKQIIDTLGILDEKTRGNLDPDEDRLLKTVLYDLRLRFVQKGSGKKS